MVADLTGLPLANASLLDEATAAAEAMDMCFGVAKSQRDRFFVSEDCHPQTIAVVRTRARPLGITVEIGRPEEADLAGGKVFGLLLQYPTTDGRVEDYTGAGRARARRGRAGGGGLRPAGPHAAPSAGRVRRGHRRRLLAALRRAAGLRRPPRRVPGHPRRAQAPDAGAAHRRLQGRGGPAGLPHGPADARAAHPAREGHQQHLHRAGAAGGHGRHVRRLPRPGRPAPHRRARPRPDRRAGAGAAPAGTRSRRRALLRHPAGPSGARGRRGHRWPERAPGE